LEADADVGHQRRAAGRALLHHVEHRAAVQDGEVRRVADRVDQPRQHGPGETGQRLLAGVGAADLERAHAQLAGERGRGHRAGLPGLGLQQRERLAGGRNATGGGDSRTGRRHAASLGTG
jgi:hypothetical protein